MSRPDRSDAHLSPEEEARREAETREFFDGTVPKRHTKPQRSEHSSDYADQLGQSDGGDGPIPELDKFRDLESHTEKLVCQGSNPDVEFVETEYYKDLNSVDKQHHTTGTGFISVDKSNGSRFGLASDSSCACHGHFKGNPATNDWIPSADMVIPASNKPSRSDA